MLKPLRLIQESWALCSTLSCGDVSLSFSSLPPPWFLFCLQGMFLHNLYWNRPAVGFFFGTNILITSWHSRPSRTHTAGCGVQHLASSCQENIAELEGSAAVFQWLTWSMFEGPNVNESKGKDKKIVFLRFMLLYVTWAHSEHNHGNLPDFVKASMKTLTMRFHTQFISFFIFLGFSSFLARFIIRSLFCTFKVYFLVFV